MEVSEKPIIQEIASLSGMDEQVIRSELSLAQEGNENLSIEELRAALVKYLEDLDQEMQDKFVTS